MSERDLRHNGGDECQIVEELLSAFIDEELNATADAFVRHHLDSCSRCLEKLDDLKATVEAINELPNEATPEHDLWPGIVAASSGGSLGAPVGVSDKRHRRIPTPMLIAAGLAALLAPAGVFAGMSLLRDNTPPADEEPLRSEGWDEEGWGEFGLEAGEMAREIAESVRESMARARERAARERERAPRMDRGTYAGMAALIEALSDDDPEVRVMAARSLGEGDYEHEEVIDALSLAVREDPNDEARRWAAWALGEIEDSRAIPALSHCVRNDSYAEARRWAAWAMGEIEDSRGVEALSAAVREDSEPQVRRWAAWALGEIESPAAVDGLCHALLNDASVEVRRWSAWALGEIEDLSAADCLSQALNNDDSAEVRRWAIWALGELERR